MFSITFVTICILMYLGTLFMAAYYAEKSEKSGSSLVSNPYVYSLSMAVYCTSWTFYGSVGKAATSGLSFLTIYIGPTLMASLWWIVLRKIILISKRNRITTISDFIGSRYGNSIFLSALVAIVAVVGITPYLGLQMKAIIKTFAIMSGEVRGSAEAGWLITFIVGMFAVIFGARRLDASERHEGLIFAIAFESIVKLAAFLLVGIFVTYGIFDGFGDIFGRIRNSQYGELLYMGGGTAVSYTEWASLLFLSMMAIMFLPRQFHVAVVENSDVSHISKAMWLFPLYMLLINVFVLPVAFGGLLLGGSRADADSFVLTIPLSRRETFLALLVFLGGFSAATGMIIVESVALSTMVMNNLVMPAIFRFNKMRGFPSIILNLKRLTILGSIFMGYFFAVSIGEFYSLVDIGLKSFEAVTIFAPSILIGLYWKKGNRNGAIAGIAAGFLVWFYTLLMPAGMKAGLVTEDGVLGYLVRSDLFNPHALFGLRGLDRWTHSLFWGLFFNIFFYALFSIFTAGTEEEERQALLFVDSYSLSRRSSSAGFDVGRIENVLGQYIGRREARDFTDSFISRNAMQRDSLTAEELFKMREEAERILSGALGSSISAIIFEDKVTLTEQERSELSDSIRQITDTLRLSRQELAEANRNLAYLKDFSENIIDSAPLGIVTVDSALKVKSWNREMKNITGIDAEDASGLPIYDLLTWLKRGMLESGFLGETVLQAQSLDSFKVNISSLKNPSGGLVVIIEDITEKKKMEEQLLHSSKLASIGRLTAGISHEIGNPLASISSLVQELGSYDPHSEADAKFAGEALRTINSHIERIVRIVRSLGDFARISSSEKIVSNLSEILERTVSLVGYDKRFKNIRLAADIAEVAPIKVNPDQIQQVFFNILLNSLDAMPEGGDLSISMKDENDSLKIVFSDTGQGIDDAVTDRIFDPFFTTKHPGKGTGMGLSICYGIIKEHNGVISVRSVKGKGTAFTILLPRSAPLSP